MRRTRIIALSPDVDEALERLDDGGDDVIRAAMHADRDERRQTVGRQHGDVILAPGSERLEVFGQGFDLEEQGNKEIVQQVPQPGIGGHRLENFPEKRPDDRIGVCHKQQHRPLLFLNAAQCLVVPPSPQNAFFRKFDFGYFRGHRNLGSRRRPGRVKGSRLGLPDAVGANDSGFADCPEAKVRGGSPAQVVLHRSVRANP